MRTRPHSLVNTNDAADHLHDGHTRLEALVARLQPREQALRECLQGKCRRTADVQV